MTCYVFIGLWTDSLHSVLSSLIAIHIPLIIRRCIGLPLSFLLSLIPLYLRSTLVLSSGALLITLSVATLLSCMIHRLTKRWYCRPWTMSPSPCYFTRSSPSAVYKDVLVATWTLSLSSCAIRTSRIRMELHKSFDFPVSLLSAAA